MTYDLMIPLAVGVVGFGVTIGLGYYSMAPLWSALTFGILMFNYGVNGMAEDKATVSAQAVATANALRANNCRMTATDDTWWLFGPGPTATFECQGVKHTYAADVSRAWEAKGAEP